MHFAPRIIDLHPQALYGIRRSEPLPAFFKLPSEFLIMEILSRLEVDDLCRFGRVSRFCLHQSLDTSLWKRLFVKYGDDRPILQNRVRDTRQAFIAHQIARFSKYLATHQEIIDSTITDALALSPSVFLYSVDIYVDLPRTAPITGAALARIAANPYMRAFSLRSTDVRQFVHLSDADLVSFVKTAKNVTRLAIMGCPNVTAKGIQDVCHAASHVTDVWVESDALSNQVVESLVVDHPHLRSLRLAGRPNYFGDRALKAIGQHAQELELLDVRIYKVAFSSERVKKVFTKLPKVSDLSLQGAKKITDKTIEILCKNSKRLRSLYLGNCSKISTKSIQTLAIGLPNLESLDLLRCKKPKKLEARLRWLQTNGYFQCLRQLSIS